MHKPFTVYPCKFRRWIPLESLWNNLLHVPTFGTPHTLSIPRPLIKITPHREAFCIIFCLLILHVSWSEDSHTLFRGLFFFLGLGDSSSRIEEGDWLGPLKRNKNTLEYRNQKPSWKNTYTHTHTHTYTTHNVVMNKMMITMTMTVA